MLTTLAKLGLKFAGFQPTAEVIRVVDAVLDVDNFSHPFAKHAKGTSSGKNMNRDEHPIQNQDIGLKRLRLLESHTPPLVGVVS